MGNRKIILERHGYKIEVEFPQSVPPEKAAAEMVAQAECLDRSLAEAFQADAWDGSKPAVSKKYTKADDDILMNYIAGEDAPRSQSYIKANSPLPKPRAAAALIRLLKSQELELAPATYKNSAGKDKPMTGVFIKADEMPESLLPAPAE